MNQIPNEANVCANCEGVIGDLASGRDPEELCDTCYEDMQAASRSKPMPPTNEAASDVTQADRDAAAERLNSVFDGSPIQQTQERIISGKYDRHPWVQAFARHRIAATRKHDPSALVEALKAARDYVSDFADGSVTFNSSIQNMAANDLARIDAALAEASQ